ncbi:hypothetical protein GMOD_00003776 [Pyrenophora seminiperda CCB06]|uniref:Uncharacterized protein n=1 Tax=Pyrenophora seminiperda CCB06 TaxID=1302712 RepID=A0A3M7MKH1_9PLEO|nr:hypothetical protein GMOD_00003776 [Pyrenophora seminiperda CCB06]
MRVAEIMTDFRTLCQRAYLRANAGIRWVSTRASILRGQKPNINHMGALQQADATLRNVSDSSLQPVFPYDFREIKSAEGPKCTGKSNWLTIRELMAISDAFVESTLRTADAGQGKWLNEDPTLSQIQQVLMSRR